MTLTINDTTMTSDQTAHTARLAPGSPHLWEVSWLPGRALDRNSAITAMVLADHAGERDLNERHRLWPFIENWAAELGLTGRDAVNQVSRPGALGQQHDREGERLDPEAGQRPPGPVGTTTGNLDQPTCPATPRVRRRPATTSPRPPAGPARTRRADGWPTPSMRPPA